MPFPLHPLSRSNLAGPEFFDLVESLAQAGADLAVLRSATPEGRAVIACEPVLTIELTAERRMRWIAHGDVPAPALPASGAKHPLEALDEILAAVAVQGKHPLANAWIGQIGYDISSLIEAVGSRAPDDTRWPLLRWTFYDCYLEPVGAGFTAHTCEWPVARRESGAVRLERIARKLAAANPVTPAAPSSVILAAPPREAFLAAVGRAKEYIAAGDIYQANLAQRWAAKTTGTAARLYRRLCEQSPAEYSALLTFGDRAAISASPELLLEKRGSRLLTRPIKGTRPRDVLNEARDAFLALDLFSSDKDKAELAMIVDLLRNDLGRISKFGSVKVTSARTLEKLPTLWHTTATIESLLASPPPPWSAVIAALCPGGSVTGAPKIRATQIIDELESHRRGLYCGNIGVISPGGDATLNIAIRTLQMIGETVYLWSGGGIVADPNPEHEYAETLHKAAALFRALDLEVPHG